MRSVAGRGFTSGCRAQSRDWKARRTLRWATMVISRCEVVSTARCIDNASLAMAGAAILLAGCVAAQQPANGSGVLTAWAFPQANAVAEVVVYDNNSRTVSAHAASASGAGLAMNASPIWSAPMFSSDGLRSVALQHLSSDKVLVLGESAGVPGCRLEFGLIERDSASNQWRVSGLAAVNGAMVRGARPGDSEVPTEVEKLPLFVDWNNEKYTATALVQVGGMWPDPLSPSNDTNPGILECSVIMTPVRGQGQPELPGVRGSARLVGVGTNMSLVRNAKGIYVASTVRDPYRGRLDPTRPMMPLLRVLARSSTGTWEVVPHPSLEISVPYGLFVAEDGELRVSMLQRSEKGLTTLRRARWNPKAVDGKWETSDLQTRAEQPLSDGLAFWEASAAGFPRPWIRLVDSKVVPLVN